MGENCYLKWKDVYSVGNKDLDNQHKYMFELLNNLFCSLQEGSGGGAFQEWLDKARLYGSLHFESEEKFMAESGYPLLPSHRESHEDYVGRLDAICRAAGPDAHFELFMFLKDWWLDHISFVDLDYAHWMAEQANKAKERLSLTPAVS